MRIVSVRVGRPAAPTAIKEARNNPGRRPLNGQEPKPSLASADVPPILLTFPPAVELWNRIAPELVAVRCLTTLDVDRLATGVLAFAKGSEMLAQECVKKRPAPRLYMALKLIDKGSVILGLFGMSPAERARLHITPDHAHGDPIEAYRQAPKRTA